MHPICVTFVIVLMCTQLFIFTIWHQMLFNSSDKAKLSRNVKQELFSQSGYKVAVDVRQNSLTRSNYLFSCTNIHLIDIKNYISHGYSKEVFLGEYKGIFVAVKMVTVKVADVWVCLKRLHEKGVYNNYNQARCFGFPNMKVMKEILLLQELSHPNLIQLLGYCIRSEEIHITDLRKHGVIEVHEYGESLHLNVLRNAPWSERLRHAIELTSLLCYLEHSPIGSLVLHDFKLEHFLLVNSTIKVIDLDDADIAQVKCNDVRASASQDCDFGLKCVNGSCDGLGAKRMLYNMNRLLYRILLIPINVPEHVSSTFRIINNKLEKLTINASELLRELQSLQDTLITLRN